MLGIFEIVPEAAVLVSFVNRPDRSGAVDGATPLPL